MDKDKDGRSACVPLSGTFPGNDWPDDVKRRRAPLREPVVVERDAAEEACDELTNLWREEYP